MRKNKITFFLAVLLILLVEGNLQAQTGVVFLVPFVAVSFLEAFLKSLPLLLKLLPVIVLASIIKTWLLKRKLSLPWKLKPVEKLSLATLAETIVETFFFLIISGYFAPAVSSALTDIGLTFAPTKTGELMKVIVHILIAVPYQCFMGAALILLLIHLVSPMDSKILRGHFKYGAALAVLIPVLVTIYIFLYTVVFKSSTVQ